MHTRAPCHRPARVTCPAPLPSPAGGGRHPPRAVYARRCYRPKRRFIWITFSSLLLVILLLVDNFMTTDAEERVKRHVIDAPLRLPRPRGRPPPSVVLELRSWPEPPPLQAPPRPQPPQAPHPPPVAALALYAGRHWPARPVYSAVYNTAAYDAAGALYSQTSV